jgi:hypothetical protein
MEALDGDGAAEAGRADEAAEVDGGHSAGGRAGGATPEAAPFGSVAGSATRAILA